MTRDEIIKLARECDALPLDIAQKLGIRQGELLHWMLDRKNYDTIVFSIACICIERDLYGDWWWSKAQVNKVLDALYDFFTVYKTVKGEQNAWL